MDNKLATIERLVAENSRLHKEIQDIRQFGSADAYTPYIDAGAAFDMLKSVGLGKGKPDIRLIDLVREMLLALAETHRYMDKADKTIAYYKAMEDTIVKVGFGKETKEIDNKHVGIRQVAKLRATLELIKVRLERMEKFNHNEDTEQLLFDLNRFLSIKEGDA